MDKDTEKKEETTSPVPAHDSQSLLLEIKEEEKEVNIAIRKFAIGLVSEQEVLARIEQYEKRREEAGIYIVSSNLEMLLGFVSQEPRSQSTFLRLEKSINIAHPGYIQDLYMFLLEAAQDTPDEFVLITNNLFMEFSGLNFADELIEGMLPEEDLYDDLLSKKSNRASRKQALDTYDNLLNRSIPEWKDEIFNIYKDQSAKSERKALLEKLYHALATLNEIYGILSADDMRQLGEAIQRLDVPQAVGISPAMKLHQRLTAAGAYDRLRQLDPRRATVLQTYLTTEKPIKELGALPGVGLRGRTHIQEVLHSSMAIAFFALPEQEREEYGNNPAEALKTRSAQQTQTKSERIKDASNARRRAIQEGTYTGKPVGRPRRRAQDNQAQTATAPDQ